MNKHQQSPWKDFFDTPKGRVVGLFSVALFVIIALSQIQVPSAVRVRVKILSADTTPAFDLFLAPADENGMMVSTELEEISLSLTNGVYRRKCSKLLIKCVDIH